VGSPLLLSALSNNGLPTALADAPPPPNPGDEFVPLLPPPTSGSPTFDRWHVSDLPRLPATAILVSDSLIPTESARSASPGTRRRIAARRRPIARASHGSCEGQTDNPHNSTHYPGYVLVSSRTVCTEDHSVSVEVDLYREVFGDLYFLDSGSNSGTRRTDANARWNCPSGAVYRFWGFGDHQAGGDHQPAATSNAATVTCD